MTEEEFIESRIQYWKDLRNRFIKHYQELDGVVDEETLSKVGDIITTAEQRIIELRKQLTPPMSQRQLRALEEIPKAWAEVTGKKAADKTLKEYADIAAGRIFIDADNVAHVNGTIDTQRMVIEAAPRRTGRMFRNWLCNYFK